ncbi:MULTISPECIES: MarR family transcriptional regulator [unclassified Cryobacterium]|uniref:MarR family winged helix-turn-helix transcriptional regulator n=1 Tax=unclassified Cryobacterium TaxID=2649013 RepID=UPI002AB3576C|nr:MULTISPECIES: MarR family transcriptional regulator [Cryobacterium]MDY7544437.1 MarR family transcriptional regulator [Cryobacterium sp. 5B3]MEB0000616.1 MarR family transcriptional regulator [Cryobacterium sp. RTS3]MEB0267830.1 MarR family transcriptional regulator [Cryobacterium sp. 10I5]MEB0276628.1 MarR family transcriptional regulator [Cryobacterium sp. 5B3]MEC5152562.1 DNA-binding MarR family transcriptional regulator [Cryobacterium psychrotolerans]
MHELAAQWERRGHDSQQVELIALVRSTAMHLRSGADVVLAAHGLSREIFDILAALYRADGDTFVTQAQLAGQMFVTQAGMKKRLGRLHEMGLVTRSVDPKDARQYQLALTDDGRAVLDGVLDEFFAAEAASLGGLAEADQRQLIRLLQRLLAHKPG